MLHLQIDNGDRATFHSRAINRDSAIRVRSVPDYRLRRLRETALSPVVQPAEAVPAAIGDPADSGHPAGDLRDLHTARLHPPSTIRRHHRQAARTLV